MTTQETEIHIDWGKPPLSLWAGAVGYHILRCEVERKLGGTQLRTRVKNWFSKKESRVFYYCLSYILLSLFP